MEPLHLQSNITREKSTVAKAQENYKRENQRSRSTKRHQTTPVC
uniref:Uncharacterized protein n=1 Tax=Anguilla anguilla TaxID=7936 RepID=A0A0E9XWT8_ANGAN